jgi:putative ATP-binding cassette transporter
VRLGHLEERLDEVAHWGQRLSPGEQQRLAIARALLYKPDWLFLDEATASVDEDVERLLYGLLRERLPDTTIISIGHRPSLKQWHENVLALRRDESGKGQFVPA